MSSLLFVEAFGQLSPGTNQIDSEEDDLYSVFRARAGLMGWSTTSDRRPMLWGMNDAELTAGIDASRIGWVQVGLNVGDVELPEVPRRGSRLGWLCAARCTPTRRQAGCRAAAVDSVFR